MGEILDQPDFLNAAARVLTALEPGSCSRSARRSRSSSGGCSAAPATARGRIDIDLLLLGDIEMQTEELTLPHPEVTSRRFVLEPLLELDPELTLPDGTSAATGARERFEEPARDAGGPARLGPGRRRAQRLEPGAGQHRRDLAREVRHQAPSPACRPA